MWNGLAVLRSYNFREFDIMASLTFFGALNALSTNVLTMKLRVDNNNHNLSVTNNDYIPFLQSAQFFFINIPYDFDQYHNIFTNNRMKSICALTLRNQINQG